MHIKEEKFGFNMALQCNIDARGRSVRIKLGLITLVLGIITIFLTYFKIPSLFWNSLPYNVKTLAWLINCCIIIGGLFSIWEGRKGWCIVRAMGFKTKI